MGAYSVASRFRGEDVCNGRFERLRNLACGANGKSEAESEATGKAGEIRSGQSERSRIVAIAYWKRKQAGINAEHLEADPEASAGEGELDYICRTLAHKRDGRCQNERSNRFVRTWPEISHAGR